MRIHDTCEARKRQASPISVILQSSLWPSPFGLDYLLDKKDGPQEEYTAQRAFEPVKHPSAATATNRIPPGKD